MKSRTITTSIDVSPSVLYTFTCNPENLPRWACGFALEVRPEGDRWIITTPMGDMQISFAPSNQYGVLDHRVETANGEIFNNPMRVVANGAGSEVMFTLFQTPSTSNAQFEHDAELIRSDLLTLKKVMEEELQN